MAVTPQQPPTMKVPIPAGFESFHSCVPLRGLTEAEQNGAAPTLPIIPRRLPDNRLNAPSNLPTDRGHLYGFLVNTNLDGLKYGLYDVTPATADSQFLWQDYLTGWQWTTYTGWMREGNLCGLTGVKLDGAFMGYAYVEYDLSNGELLELEYIDLEYSMTPVLVSSAYRLLDDNVYAYGYNEEGNGFCFSVAPASNPAKVTPLRDVDYNEVCAAMGYNSLTDTMYGITTDGRFVSIDTEGNLTTISDITRYITNVQPATATAMAWMPSEGAFIYNAFVAGQGTVFYAIDPSGKAPRRLGTSQGAEIYSILVSPEINAEPDAPVKADFSSFDFTTTALNGSITWKLPAKLVEGTAIKENIDWRLLIDGEAAGKGSAAPGATVTTTVDRVTNGMHTFALICSVEGYDGEPAIIHRWVGPDAPQAPANVRLTETTVTWDRPTGSIHDGYVDYDNIKYTIYLNGGKIGESKTTEFEYTLPQGLPFTSYTAEVIASYEGWESPVATSNFITYGDPLNLPVHFRPLEKQLEMMTIFNLDGLKYEDGTDNTWHFTTNMGFPAFSSGYRGDDWLILPPMNFTDTEKAYRFEMEIGLVYDSDTTGTYEVCIGKEPTVEAMTRIIVPKAHCLHMLGDIIEEFFAVPEPGVYYIGIHAMSNEVSFHVSDIDVSLSNRSAEVPLGVSDLEAKPAPDGKLSATVSFTLPTATASGREIPADKIMDVTVGSYATEPGYGKDRELVATKTLTGAPGSTHTVEIETAQNYNVIVVNCTLDGLEGKGAETMIYTGLDRPYTVNDLKVTVSEDNMSVTLTWTPPTEGEEGGPIGDSFLYVIYDYYSSAWTFLEEAGWNVTSYTYTLPEGTPLGYVTLGVMAYNAAGLSYHVLGKSAAMGTPIRVPWTNDLDNDDTYDNAIIIRPTEQYNDTYWIPGDPGAMISPIFDLPSKMAFIGYTYEATDRKTRLALPKVNTSGLNDVTLTFDYWGGRNAAPMRIYAEVFDSDEPILIAELPLGADGWTSHTVTLPATLQDRIWLMPMVEADLPDDQYYAMFSGYSFGSVSGVAMTPDGEGCIAGGKGTLTVAGHNGEALIVTDMTGRLILSRDRLEAHNVFFLPAGIYAVRAGSATAKVIVK